MLFRRLPQFSVIVLAGLVLQGCVAAAIPLAAGGLMATGAGKAASPRTQAGSAGLIDATGTRVQGARAASEPPSSPAIARAKLDALPPADRGARPIGLDDVEPGTFSVAPAPALPSTDTRGLAAKPVADAFDPQAPLVDYVNDLLDTDNALRRSAVLRDPSSLTPERVQCTGGHPTVLFDLDPAGGLFEPTAAPANSRPLLASLERMRDRGVRIAWISGQPAAMADDIRVALKGAGLDPDGTDSLILLRYREDRKQTRRRELAQNACLVAIAGDTRSDFDELFDYIAVQPSATMLETMIGKGWFLVPTAFSSQGKP